MSRTANCLAKLERMKKALGHQEGDRVPVSDFFWTGFLKRWREELGLASDANIYRYYDLDWIQMNPNLDPHIKPFEVLKESQDEIVVKTGFEAILRRCTDVPMPAFLRFETDAIDKMEAFQFDDPFDERRYFSGGDDQINGVGDAFTRNIPAFVERVNAAHPDFPVFGGVLEATENMARILGSENMLLWMGMYPDELGRFIDRIFDFSLGMVQGQIKAAGGKLDGMVIWGDVAYRKGMLYSPVFWRRHIKPGVKRLIDECHAHGLPVIYHGCGNVNKIFGDFVELGVDAYNPLEAKADMDVIKLREQFGHAIGFCGNMDVMLWAEGSKEQIRETVLRKLNAARGGGYIFQSDHSVPSNVSAERYEYVLNLVRTYGKYPLQLGQYEISHVGS